MRNALVSLAGFLLALGTSVAAQAVGASEVSLSWEAPTLYSPGSAFAVQVEVRAPEGGAEVGAWLMTPSAFSVAGVPLAPRPPEFAIALAPGALMRLDYDLGPFLTQTEDFELEFAAGLYKGSGLQVRVMRTAPSDANFMELDLAELHRYRVVLETNVGNIHLELWPDVAPNHVRNFLDLAHTGFYDGVVFHRAAPGYMIQSGDTLGTGYGVGPRQLKAELSNRKHVRGVLSMARGRELDSASSQFFIVHGDLASHLDRQVDPATGETVGCSAFGRVVIGMPVVDAIAETPTDDERPRIERVILKAHVVMAEDPASTEGK